MEKILLRMDKLQKDWEFFEDILCMDLKKDNGIVGKSEAEYGFLTDLFIKARNDFEAITDDLRRVPGQGGSLPIDAPTKLSALIPRLYEIWSAHGDLAVLVGGNDLTTIVPTIWTDEDKRVAGAELRNCVNLEGVCHG